LLKEKGKDHRIVFSNIGSFEEKERERERDARGHLAHHLGNIHGISGTTFTTVG